MHFDTRLVHAGSVPGDPHAPTSTPIYQTATFAQEDALGGGRYDYTRSGNPTREVLERQLAELEGGTHASAFASGMAVFEGGWPKYVAAAVGVVMLATALMRICPLYSLIGVRTCRMR